MGPLLDIREISVRYSGLPVLRQISLQVFPGECVAVVGANGAGKSTLLRAVAGAQPPADGKIMFNGREVQKMTTENLVRTGVVYVPEERMLFGNLTVRENLTLGAYTLEDQARVRENLNHVFELFPRLRERTGQLAVTLSGGEQQMLAIGRGLMSSPRLLMLDEPSLGLAPLLVNEVLDTIFKLKKEGMTILLVEQKVHEALSIADRGYVIQSGVISLEGTGRELLESDAVKNAYLGGL